MVWDTVTYILTAGGLFFFIAGTAGLLRFPDVFCRLHALTKADNLGLGLIVLGLLPQLRNPFLSFKVVLIWILVMAASSASCILIARYMYRQKEHYITHEDNHES